MILIDVIKIKHHRGVRILPKRISPGMNDTEFSLIVDRRIFNIISHIRIKNGKFLPEKVHNIDMKYKYIDIHIESNPRLKIDQQFVYVRIDDKQKKFIENLILHNPNVKKAHDAGEFDLTTIDIGIEL